MFHHSESRADLHIHSKYSDRPTEWFLRRIGAPECFVEPRDVYTRARQRGMDFVTISDHNCIRGALEIADLPGVFLSNEITTYFPDNGCKIHCLVSGINERQFEMIQELRANIFELHRFLIDEDIIATIAHPLFRVNDRLTPNHLEQLLLMFKRFELINGARDPRASELTAAILGQLTPEMIAQMADRHGIEPVGREPWQKWLTGGSDDHSGVYGAAAYTVTPYAENVEEYLAHLRRGDHEAGGACGGSLILGHSLYHIAYGYYKARFLNAGNKPSVIAHLFEQLLKEPSRETNSRFGHRVLGFVPEWVRSRKMRKLSEVERIVVEEFSSLFQEDLKRDAASPPMSDRRTFQIACRIGHTLGYSFLRRFERNVRDGRLIDSLQTIASLGPVTLSFAPYLAAFSTQHKDEPYLQAVAQHFSVTDHLPDKNERKAWITDTFSDVNGVCRTIQTLGLLAKTSGRKLTVITCLDQTPATSIDLKNFTPVGTFRLPEYEMQEFCFPPFLEVIEYLERHQFRELIISTPGPLGLTGLLAARLLGLRTTGIYHTDFPQLVRLLTDDEGLEQLTWKYMQWFYDQMDSIAVPSEYYRNHLIHNGFDGAKLSVMVRGVDLERFRPHKRTERFWERYGLKGPFTFLYVGRVSPDKNLESMFKAFGQLLKQGRAVNLAIVGDGPSLPEMKRRYNDPRIAFTGFLDGEELATAYASADAFVFPSTADTFGNVVLEAQAAGLPAIVADRGGPPDIVRRYESGLIVDMTQPQALAEAMDRLYRDAELYGRLRDQALRNAADSSWEQVLEDFWRPTPSGGQGTGSTASSLPAPSQARQPQNLALTKH